MGCACSTKAVTTERRSVDVLTKSNDPVESEPTEKGGDQLEPPASWEPEERGNSELEENVEVDEVDVTVELPSQEDEVEEEFADSELQSHHPNGGGPDTGAPEVAIALKEGSVVDIRNALNTFKQCLDQESAEQPDQIVLKEAILVARKAGLLDHGELDAACRRVVSLGDVGVWEEEPTGDAVGNRWRKWPYKWRLSADAFLLQRESFRGLRRATISDSCVLDLDLMTAQKQNGNKTVVLPVRRLDVSGGQTHPDSTKSHPWLAKKTSLRERGHDWLTNEFFWKAFCMCCEKAGRRVPNQPDDLFDFQHNRDYRNWDGPLHEHRGGILYAIPVGWKKFSCRVKGRFGNDNRWLRLDSGEGEWAVAYHGTSYEALVPILDGGLKIGGAQAYENCRDVRTKVKIGKGVYCSPSMAVAARYADMKGSGTTIDNRNVTFVLQCRVNPEKIKRCHDEEGDALTCNTTPYWVLNDPADIRPYGILVKEVQKDVQ